MALFEEGNKFGRRGDDSGDRRDSGGRGSPQIFPFKAPKIGGHGLAEDFGEIRDATVGRRRTGRGKFSPVVLSAAARGRDVCVFFRRRAVDGRAGDGGGGGFFARAATCVGHRFCEFFFTLLSLKVNDYTRARAFSCAE